MRRINRQNRTEVQVPAGTGKKSRATISKPFTVAVPDVGGTSVVSIRRVVVFPAPLGPSWPKTSPSSMSRLRWSTAARFPYILVRSWMAMAGIPQSLSTGKVGAAGVNSRGSRPCLGMQRHHALSYPPLTREGTVFSHPGNPLHHPVHARSHSVSSSEHFLSK